MASKEAIINISLNKILLVNRSLNICTSKFITVNLKNGPNFKIITFKNTKRNQKSLKRCNMVSLTTE